MDRELKIMFVKDLSFFLFILGVVILLYLWSR